jgi:hypothetical protein
MKNTRHSMLRLFTPVMLALSLTACGGGGGGDGGGSGSTIVAGPAPASLSGGSITFNPTFVFTSATSFTYTNWSGNDAVFPNGSSSGTYTYTRTGANTGNLNLVFADGTRFSDISLIFSGDVNAINSIQITAPSPSINLTTTQFSDLYPVTSSGSAKPPAGNAPAIPTLFGKTISFSNGSSITLTSPSSLNKIGADLTPASGDYVLERIDGNQLRLTATLQSGAIVEIYNLNFSTAMNGNFTFESLGMPFSSGSFSVVDGLPTDSGAGGSGPSQGMPGTNP